MKIITLLRRHRIYLRIFPSTATAVLCRPHSSNGMPQRPVIKDKSRNLCRSPHPLRAISAKPDIVEKIYCTVTFIVHRGVLFPMHRSHKRTIRTSSLARSKIILFYIICKYFFVYFLNFFEIFPFLLE